MDKRKMLWMGLIIGLLLLHMVTFQVPFGHFAAVSTFGRLGPDSIVTNAPAGAGFFGNLHFKWPWPIQDALFFDGRLQVLEDPLAEQQIKDGDTVILNTFLVWRIAPSLEFPIKMKTVRDAQKQLRDRLQDARAEISRFSLDELTHPDPAQLKLAAAEEAVFQRLRSDLDRSGPYGLELLSAGIRRILLPEEVNKKVFDQMRGLQEARAQNAKSEGDAEAQRIVEEAKSLRDRILAFAQYRAQKIRDEGDAAAAGFYKEFAQDEELANLLRKIETARKTLKHHATIFLDSRLEPYDLLSAPRPGEPKGEGGPRSGTRGNERGAGGLPGGGR